MDSTAAISSTAPAQALRSASFEPNSCASIGRQFAASACTARARSGAWEETLEAASAQASAAKRMVRLTEIRCPRKPAFFGQPLAQAQRRCGIGPVPKVGPTLAGQELEQ